jgi:hypothetical protein
MTSHGYQERWSASWKLAMNFATGFLIDFCGLRAARPKRKETVRFPGEPTKRPSYPPIPKTAGAASSDELLDLADRIGGAPAGGLQLRMPS